MSNTQVLTHELWFSAQLLWSFIALFMSLLNISPKNCELFLPLHLSVYLSEDRKITVSRGQSFLCKKLFILIYSFYYSFYLIKSLILFIFKNIKAGDV